MHSVYINSSLGKFGEDTQYNDSTKYMQYHVVVLCAKTLIQDRHRSVNEHSVSLESISCEGPDSAVFRYAWRFLCLAIKLLL